MYKCCLGLKITEINLKKYLAIIRTTDLLVSYLLPGTEVILRVQAEL